MLRARGRAALATLAALPRVDATRMAAVGFCFGGSVVLELVRDGSHMIQSTFLERCMSGNSVIQDVRWCDIAR